MEYAKIIVKGDYNTRGDLVLRSYIRALIKIKAVELLENGRDIEYALNCTPFLNNIRTAYIYGVLDDEGHFNELFTGRKINYHNYQIIDSKELKKLKFISEQEKDQIKKVVEKVLFNEENDLDIEPSTEEELALDQYVEFVAYDRCFSVFYPYRGIDYNNFDNFQIKLREAEKIYKKVV